MSLQNVRNCQIVHCLALSFGDISVLVSPDLACLWIMKAGKTKSIIHRIGWLPRAFPSVHLSVLCVSWGPDGFFGMAGSYVKQAALSKMHLKY